MASSNRFSSARHAFRDAHEDAMVGREKEAAILDTFFRNCFAKKHGGNLYISGIAGTGKTSLVKQWLRENTTTIAPPNQIIAINVMSCKRAVDVFRHIAEALVKLGGLPAETKMHRDCHALLDAYFSKQPDGGAMCCLILDEIDQLDARTIWKLFGWPRVIVVGIANTLDFITRKLAGNAVGPQHLAIKPYSTDEISAIISTKWQSAKEPLISPTALEICARKVAAASGDIRKAISICLCAIDCAEQDGLTHITLDSIMKGINKMTGEDARTRSANLNLHQKALLVCILRMQRSQTETEWTLRKVAKSNFMSITTPNPLIRSYDTDTSGVHNHSKWHRPFTAVINNDFL